jgi:molybdopterin synthase sulfur carrier subunit
MICVVLPFHLQGLANSNREVFLEINAPITVRSVLDALEVKHPVLRGTIRDHVTKERRAFIRFFACGEDISHQSVDVPLPASVADGTEKFRIVGALAGG